MKNFYKSMLSVIGCFLLSYSSFGQVTLGLKGGLNLTSLTTEAPYSGIEYRPRLHAGILSRVALADKLFLQPELLYSFKGWGLKEVVFGEQGRGSMNLHYVSLPVLLGCRINSRFSLMAGPELSYLFKFNRKPAFEPSYDVKNMYRKWDAGVAIGGMYQVNPQFGIEVRFVHGVTGIVNNNWIELTHGAGAREQAFNKVWQVGLFYLLKSTSAASVSNQ